MRKLLLGAVMALLPVMGRAKAAPHWYWLPVVADPACAVAAMPPNVWLAMGYRMGVPMTPVWLNKEHLDIASEQQPIDYFTNAAACESFLAWTKSKK